MKTRWQERTLGELLEKTATFNPMLKPEAEFDYIDVSSISNQLFRITHTQRLKGKDAPSRARRLVQTNDILFATVRPTLQRIAIVPAELDNQVCSTGYIVLRPKPSLDHRFLFYWLFAEDFMGQMASLQKGASYPAVTDGDVRSQRIPFPPLPEQRRIVGILDEAFAGIATAKANAKTNLYNARALFESHLNAIFSQRGEGWVETTLREAVATNCTLSYGIVQPGTEYADGMPVVRPTDLTTRIVHRSGLKRIDPSLARGYNRTTLRGGDLLLCVRGSTGSVSIASAELAGANVTRGIVPIRFEPSLVAPGFGYYLLSSPAVQSQIAKKTYGAALMQINIRDLRQVKLSFPTLSEQQIVADTLEILHTATQLLESIYQRKLVALEAFKKSLLHQAFSGEL